MGASDVTLPALKPNITSLWRYDAAERSPMDYRDYVDWDLPCLLTVAIPSVCLWPVSTSPKRLLLVTKFIIAKFRMNSMVRRVQGKASKCGSERTECRVSIHGATLCGLTRILLLQPSTRHVQVGNRLYSCQLNSVMVKQLCEFVLKLVKIWYSLFVNSLLFLWRNLLVSLCTICLVPRLCHHHQISSPAPESSDNPTGT
jgi:predicted membrane protein